MALTTLVTANSLGDWAYIAVEKHFRKTIKHEADVLKDKDPEALHQMRVGMRRLRTAVTGFAPALDLPKEAQSKNIGKIARILGSLRDLDVLQEALENHYKPLLPKSEQKILKKALDYLVKQRQQAFKDVETTLGNSRYQNLKQTFEKWLEEPNYQVMAQIPIEEVLPDLLLPQVSQLLLHPGWLIGVKAEKGEIHPLKDMTHQAVEAELAAQGQILHSLRKQTKRVRYQMELFANFYGATYAAYLKDMKAVQEVLGQIQDSVVLSEFLAEARQDDSDSLPPTLAEKLAENRYQAWQKWQPLQTRYLNHQIRQSFRSELLRPKKVMDDSSDSKKETKV